MKRFVGRITDTSPEYSCQLQQPNSFRTWRVAQKGAPHSIHCWILFVSHFWSSLLLQIYTTQSSYIWDTFCFLKTTGQTLKFHFVWVVPGNFLSQKHPGIPNNTSWNKIHGHEKGAQERLVVPAIAHHPSEDREGRQHTPEIQTGFRKHPFADNPVNKLSLLTLH